MNREAIYSALWEKFAGIQGIKTRSRRLKHWADTPQSEQPALFMAQRHEQAQTISGTDTRWTFSVDLYLYVNPTGDAPPGMLLNPLLDAIEAALAPDNPVRNTCTLGGLVEHARIEGTIETDEGTLGDQAVAIIPVIIFTT